MHSTDRDRWLEAALRRWERSLLRTCYAYLGDIALAEDAVQETFLKAWKGLDRFRGEAKEQTWLMRIAINTCKDMRRGAWFRRVTPGPLPEGAEPFTPEDDAVVRAIMALKPKLRAVVLLRWYQEMPGDEVAEALGISRSAVYSRLNKAHELLRKELEVWHRET